MTYTVSGAGTVAQSNLYKVLIVSFILSTLLFFSSSSPLLWDEGQQAVSAYFLHTFLEEKPADVLNYALEFNYHFKSGSLFFIYPPLFRVLSSLSMDLLGISREALRLPLVLFSTLALAGTYRLGELLTKKSKIGWISMVLLFVSPVFLQYGKLAFLEVPVMAMFLWSMIFYLQNQRTLFLAFSVLTFYTKPAGVLLWIPVAMDMLLKKRYLQLLKDGLTYVVLIIPWLLLVQFQPFSTPVVVGHYVGGFLTGFGGVDHLLSYFGAIFLQLSPLTATFALVGLIMTFKERDDVSVAWFVGVYLFFTIFAGPTEAPDTYFRFTILALPILAVLAAKAIVRTGTFNALPVFVLTAFSLYSLSFSPISTEYLGIDTLNRYIHDNTPEPEVNELIPYAVLNFRGGIIVAGPHYIFHSIEYGGIHNYYFYYTEKGMNEDFFSRYDQFGLVTLEAVIWNQFLAEHRPYPNLITVMELDSAHKVFSTNPASS